MTIKTNEKIMIGSELFYGADDIGFTKDGYFVLDLYTFDPQELEGRANYHICLPISHMNYRKDKQTKAAVKDCKDYIQIYDDWGTMTRIASAREVLEDILEECRNHLLPFLND